MYIYKRHVCPGSNTDTKAEAVMVLVFAFMNFKSKLEDPFTILNSFRRSIEFSKVIHAFYPKI